MKRFLTCAFLVAMGTIRAADLASGPYTIQERRIDLAGTWMMHETENNVQIPFPADVPGGVHAALRRAGRMVDPFFGRNEREVQDIAKKNWTFERSFEVSEEFLASKSIILRLEDVDLFCTVELNGEKIGPETDNRYRRWDFDVKRFLHVGANRIAAHFSAAEAHADRIAAAYDRVFDIARNGLVPHINMLRKPVTHGGWDWGLALMNVGLCGTVELVGYDEVRMDYVTCDQKFAPDYSWCEVTASALVASPFGGEVPVSVELGTVRKEQTFRLVPGRNRVRMTVRMENPELWWPNDQGLQRRYAFCMSVGRAKIIRQLGLRKLEVLNERDKDPVTGKEGYSLVFSVNGRRIFMKGADWIPCSAIENEQTPARYRDLLTSAKRAHMNMVRLWGGGQFEHEAFYDLCDELGLLIWHDFMFCCANYPGDEKFLAPVKRELEHQILRLRDHASIALWCGDNECIGALKWFEASRKDRPYYLQQLQNRIKMIDGVVREFDPARVFWPSSPCCGPGDFGDGWKEDSKGDMHNWEVWHGNKPFADYYRYRPRFCSEFGYQSFPSPEVARTFCAPAELNPTAPDFEYHQKNGGGNARMLETMARYFRFPEGTDNILYLSQVQQALAIRTAVEGWRRQQPRCMGTLFWQLNDDWPVSSWSSIEYGGKWKHLQYQAKRFYAPVAVMAAPDLANPSNIEVWAVNDTQEAVEGTLLVQTLDFRGESLKDDTREVEFAPGATKLVTYPVASFGTEGERRGRFLSLALQEGARILYQNEWMFNAYKVCPLADAKVTIAPENRSGRWLVEVKTDRPAFFVWVNAEGVPGEFSDNSFTLYPDRPVTLEFVRKNPTARFADFRAGLSVTHLRATYR